MQYTTVHPCGEFLGTVPVGVNVIDALYQTQICLFFLDIKGHTNLHSNFCHVYMNVNWYTSGNQHLLRYAASLKYPGVESQLRLLHCTVTFRCLYVLAR